MVLSSGSLANLAYDRSQANVSKVSPRRSAAAAARTREAIVERAVAVASTQGLEGLTVGRLAADLGLSKSGVIGHFGSKEGLQLAALDAALRVFREEVWERAASEPSGRARLRALCDAWLSYLERGVFPGGCFLTAASSEFDDREGPVHDAVSEALGLWLSAIEREAEVAIKRRELSPAVDSVQVAFELNALAMGANQALQLRGDRAALALARHGMARALEPGGEPSG